MDPESSLPRSQKPLRPCARFRNEPFFTVWNC